MKIKNLVETTWVTKYPCPIESMFDQGLELIVYWFLNILIELEYGIKLKPYSSSNMQANAIIDRIYHVLDSLLQTYNLQKTYVYDADPWMGILVTPAFDVWSTQRIINN